MRLNGKNALITGASRGIGRATAELFVREGANVWAFAKTGSGVFEAWCAETAAKYGVFVKPICADLADEAAVSTAVKQAMADKLPLDILVNNAGITIRAMMVPDMTEEAWDKVLAVQLKGHFT
ncbi:MAG: SDR family NAD(P)-dependent oxidoreductase, partial [Bacillota bacterium]